MGGRSEMPHEVRYDQFGLAIACHLYGREALDAEVHALLESGLGGSETRLKKMLQLEPRLDLGGVGEEIADFALPYKNVFLEKWTNDRRRGLIGLIQFLPEPELLWPI